jgi:hypothetical protein
VGFSFAGVLTVCRKLSSHSFRLTYMQYLNMLSKGLVGEAVEQKEKESAAYLE